MSDTKKFLNKPGAVYLIGKIKALLGLKADADLSNVDASVFLEKAQAAGAAGTPIVAAASTDGVTYTATVDGVTELTVGLTIVIIPDIASTNVAPKLNVNGLGDKYLRLLTGYNTTTTTTAAVASWLAKGKPVQVRWNGTYWITDLQRASANALSGIVKVENGGTGASTAEEALANLGITDLVTDIGNLHVWEREHPIDEWYEVEPVFTPTIYPDLIVVNSVYSSVSFTYASEIAVDADGNLSLVSPKSITFRSSAGLSSYVATASVLKGMYANFTNCEGCYTKSDFVYFPEDCTFYVPSNYSVLTVDKIQHVTGHPAGYTSDYTTSNDPDAYPESGTVDDATYTYLGQLGAGSAPGAKIETGSYVGTGTYGASNPCSLTFDFAPKLLFIETNGGNKNGSLQWYRGLEEGYIIRNHQYFDGNYSTLIWGENSVSWYGSSAVSQLNETNYTYKYTAIG